MAGDGVKTLRFPAVENIEVAAAGESKSSAAYHQLKSMILGFRLRSGEMLSERALEQILNSSRTSIRAAIARIEVEGLMRREGRSYVVTPINPQEIEDAHDFLMIIETAALMQARTEGLHEKLEALEEELSDVEASASVDSFIETTLKFHHGLVALANNPFLERAEADAATRLTRAAWLTRWIQRETRADWSEAHQIIALMRSGDRVAAGEVLVRLLTKSKQQMTQLVRDEQRGLLARGIAVM